MEKLQEVMNEVFVEYEKSGKIKELFEKNIESCIAKVVEEEFRWNGSAKKAIEEQIQKAIPTKLDFAIDLTTYNHVAGNILKEKLGTFFTEEATRNAENMIDELLQVAPAEMTLHELAEAFVKQYEEDAQQEGWEYPFIELDEDLDEDNTDSYTLRFKPTKEEYYDDYSLHVYKGKILSIKFRDNEELKQKFSGRVYDFERKLFQLYACKVKLVRGEFDPDDYSYDWAD